MTDVGFGELVVRMVVSLGIVLALMFGAYTVLRRRQGFGAPSIGLRTPRLLPSRSGTSLGAAGGQGRATRPGKAGKLAGNRRGLRVIGRVGVGRTSQVVAIQFAERVLLVGACDQAAPQVLAELDLPSWTQHLEAEEEQDVIREAIVPGPKPRPTSLLDSLREATARRA